MKPSTFRFARVKNSLPHVAIVSLAVTENSKPSEVRFSCSGVGFTSQGYIEEVPAVGYDGWKNGAKAGALFALDVAGKKNCGIEISKIEGMATDTNPTIVGVAAAFAVWQSFAFQPPQEVAAKLEDQALSSWNLPHDTIPEFA